MAIELEGLMSKDEYLELIKANLVKPLSEKEYWEFYKIYDREASEEVYGRCGFPYFYTHHLPLKLMWGKMNSLHRKKNITIYNIGVGEGGQAVENIVYIWKFFQERDVGFDLYNFEGVHEYLKGLIKGWRDRLGNLPSNFHFHEADLYLEPLECKADMVIGLNILASRTINLHCPQRDHILFDNLVRGTKKDGYLIVNAVPRKPFFKDDKPLNAKLYDNYVYEDRRSDLEAFKGIDMDAYGLKYVAKFGESTLLLKRVKMKRVLSFL